MHKRFCTPAILASAVFAVLLAGHSSYAAAQPRGGDRDWKASMTAREEINQRFQLAPGARVSVSGIAGPVTIETGGGNVAEVHILRMAESQADLDCYRTEVSGTRESLRIEHVQRSSDRSCRSIRARQEVRLRLPRSVDVSLSSVAGSVRMAAVEGLVSMNSIAGHVSLAGARAARIESLAGGLSLTLDPIRSPGVRVSSVVGPVDLFFRRGVDAEVRLDSVMGSVRSATPGVDITEGYGTYRARIGRAGPAVNVSSVVGPVRLSRL